MNIRAKQLIERVSAGESAEDVLVKEDYASDSLSRHREHVERHLPAQHKIATSHGYKHTGSYIHSASPGNQYADRHYYQGHGHKLTIEGGDSSEGKSHWQHYHKGGFSAEGFDNKSMSNYLNMAHKKK